MIKKNVKKVRELSEKTLQAMLDDWQSTHQFEPFDIVLNGRYGNPTILIRAIDSDCGLVIPLTEFYRISTAEKEEDGCIERLNYIDPEGGPLLSLGGYKYSEESSMNVQEIYLKGRNGKKYIVIFYDIVKNSNELEQE